MSQLPNYTIRPLKKSDAELLKYWGEFNDPLFYGYEYNDLNNKEKEIWYKLKTKINHCQYYSVISDEDKLIGYVGLKELNYISKTAKLGIVIDPNLVSKGYGSLILRDFLDIYFNLKKYSRLDLEVNSWNTRAIKLYEKFGFKNISSRYQKFENQELHLEEYDNYEEHFKYVRNEIYSKIYKMSLEREDFLNAN